MITPDLEKTGQEGEKALTGTMKMLSKLGDFIYVDTIDLKLCFDDDP